MQELKQRKFTNKMKWSLFVAVFILVLTGSTAAYMVINYQTTKQASAQEQYENTVPDGIAFETLLNQYMDYYI